MSGTGVQNVVLATGTYGAMGPMGVLHKGAQNVHDVHVAKAHCASRVSKMSGMVDLLALKNDLRLDKIRKDIILSF